MKDFKKMMGKRCYLSPMNPEDAEKYVAWLNDMEVAQYLGAKSYDIIYMDILAREFSGDSCLPPLSPPE